MPAKDIIYSNIETRITLELVQQDDAADLRQVRFSTFKAGPTWHQSPKENGSPLADLHENWHVHWKRDHSIKGKFTKPNHQFSWDMSVFKVRLRLLIAFLDGRHVLLVFSQAMNEGREWTERLPSESVDVWNLHPVNRSFIFVYPIIYWTYVYIYICIIIGLLW